MGVYIKFDKPVGSEAVVGECLEKDYSGYSTVSTVSFGLAKASEGLTGQSRRRGDVQFKEISVTREFDASSPSFMKAVAKGTIFGLVTIIFTASYETSGEAKSGAPTRRRVIEFQLEDVLVVSSNFEGGGEEPPGETIELNYTRFAVRYFPRSTSGAASTPIRAGWDVELCQEWMPKVWGSHSGSVSASASFSASASASASFSF